MHASLHMTCRSALLCCSYATKGISFAVAFVGNISQRHIDTSSCWLHHRVPPLRSPQIKLSIKKYAHASMMPPFTLKRAITIVCEFLES